MQCGLPTLDRMVQTTMRDGCGAAPKMVPALLWCNLRPSQSE